MQWARLGLNQPLQLHDVPVPNEPWKMKAKIASKFISLLVLQNVSTTAHGNREKTIAKLHKTPEIAGLHYRVFEIRAHKRLARGGAFEAQSLVGDAAGSLATVTFTCAPSEFWYYDPKNLATYVHETSGPNYIPRVSSFESIDSFYYPIHGELAEKRILVFQITVAKTRPVDGKVILAVLRDLGLLNTALERPDAVAIIFVAPDSDGEIVSRKQPIRWDRQEHSDGTDAISSFGQKRTENLNEINIKTLGDLRRVIGDPRQMSLEQQTFFKPTVLQTYTSWLQAFDDQQRDAEMMLQRIPQYVWRPTAGWYKAGCRKSSLCSVHNGQF